MSFKIEVTDYVYYPAIDFFDAEAEICGAKLVDKEKGIELQLTPHQFGIILSNYGTELENQAVAKEMKSIFDKATKAERIRLKGFRFYDTPYRNGSERTYNPDDLKYLTFTEGRSNDRLKRFR